MSQHFLKTMQQLLLAAVLAGAALPTTAAPGCHISNVFGDHMVLQRTQPAIVFGFAAPATVVKTTFNGAVLSAVTDASGVWRQALPPQSATATGQSISFACSTGETFALTE